MMNKPMRPVLLFILCALSDFAFGQVAIRYMVEPKPTEMTVAVKVVIDGIATNSRPEIQIAAEFGSADDYYQDIQDLEVVYPRNISLNHDSQKPNVWRLNSDINDGHLEYRYQIKVHQEKPGEIRFKPNLSSKNYYSIGYALFVYPASNNAQNGVAKKEQFSVTFKLPNGWNDVTSLNKANSGDWVAQDLDALLASTVALGDYRQYRSILPNGTPLVVALNGQWLFSDESFASSAYKIIAGQIAMMKSWHFPTYTMVLSESTERGSSGSGLTNAFEMYAHPQVPLSDLFYVISHENFHYWNGNRIRYGAPRDRWFSEGFTDYFAFVLLGRLKLTPVEAVLQNMSKSIQDYYGNPVSTSITFDDAGKYFWVWLGEYGHLFYSKGMMIALMTDIKLRQISQNQLSLDGFMRHLDNKFFDSGKNIDDKVIAAELKAYSHFDWQNIIDRFVLGKELLPVNEYIKIGGMEITENACNQADLGLTLMPHFCSSGRPCGYSAEDVTVSGPAHHAGIRQGDVITQTEPKFLQRYPAHTLVKLGVQKSDNSIKWHEYLSEEKTITCHNLSFMENADQTAKLIRNSIWNDQK